MRLLLSTLSLIAWIFSASANTTEVYTITDIPVSEKADTVVDAQAKALDAARLIGANKIIQRLTLPEDRANAGNLTPDYDTALMMSYSYDVQEEAAGGGVFRGVLSTTMIPRIVRQYLQERNVPFQDSQAPIALIVPVAEGNAYFSWVSVLPDELRTSLTPYRTAKLGRYASDADWGIVSSEAKQMGAERAILAELQGKPGSWRARLTMLSPAGRQSIGKTSTSNTLKGLVPLLQTSLETAWKRQSIARDTGVPHTMEADVTYTSLIEWNTIRRAFNQSSLVYDFDIISQNKTSAFVRIRHSSDIERFERDVLQRGVRIGTGTRRSLITSAVFGR